jgi:hypothetical protein
MFFFQEGFTFRNYLMDVLTIFVFIVWFWLLITVAADLFRRHEPAWRELGFADFPNPRDSNKQKWL